MASRTHFVLLAHYNRWATRRLATVLKQLDAPKLVRYSTQFQNTVSNSAAQTRQEVAETAQQDAVYISGARAYLESRGLPCNSIHGTMCHMLYADVMWKLRLSGQSIPAELSEMWSSSAPASVWEDRFTQVVLRKDPQTVRQLLAEAAKLEASAQKDCGDWKELPELRTLANQARNAIVMELDRSNEEWMEMTKGFSEPELAEKIKYHTTEGIEYNRTRAILLTHVFNHATHHRGQVSAPLAELTGTYPAMDMTAYLPEWEELHGKAFRWA